ncbi:uncharacterized protein LOC116301963, partial [Actinia tenebrosa]|uniref:Uncharacterized protein LOC116301963 n=1 Tax=Actinia tenebrosa TaxID=6105 RepID=A0A6P8IJN0_ACTTE
DNQSRRPKASHPRISGKQYSDRNSANWTNHRQISLGLKPCQKSVCSSKPSQPQERPRKRKDARSTIVPMFPEAFCLGRRESNSHDKLLDDILMNRKIGLKFAGESPGKLR